MGITLLINVIAVFFSILPDHDPALYAVIAKHMTLSNNWVDLILNHAGWLDKPHFPFWITALSFKLFGISSFTYIFPGFLFYLLGAYYTYVLACYLFNEPIGLFSVLMYLTSAHLMVSSVDIRAEAYLLGTIMPACYYWLRYHDSPGMTFDYLFLGAVFTAMAIMTKGIFVLVTIVGGLFALGLYHRVVAYERPKNVASFILKWGIALVLSLIFIAPELVTLYLQFDRHPEQIVFQHTHVSGLEWFFWDSQIGRFFNNGPITGHIHSYHYLFFIYTFLWSFLPWTFIFIAAIYRVVRSFLKDKSFITVQQKRAYIYLLGSFMPTFVMFSACLFQLDHYINIIVPFAAIMCAEWIYNIACKRKKIVFPRFVTRVFRAQIILSVVLTFLILLLDIAIFRQITVLIFILTLGIFLAFILLSTQSQAFKAIVYATLSINLVFIFFIVVNRSNYINYDVGYKIAQYLKYQTPHLIVEYKESSMTLAFHSDVGSTVIVDNPTQLFMQPKPYYLVVRRGNLTEIEPFLGDYQIIMQTTGLYFINNPLKIMISSLSKSGLESKLIHYLLIRKR